MKPYRRLAVAAFGALAVLGWAADPIRMDVRSTFSGPVDDTSVMTVELQNDGPDARGVLQVSGGAGPTSYPLELPRGARKRIVTFPTVPWGELEFTLSTDRGAVVKRLPASGMPQMPGGSAVLIGDDSGGLAFLRRQTLDKAAGRPEQSIQARDAYVKPEDAPGRPLAYRAFNAVFLGPGAERMGDEAVEALKRYAIGGGSIVFLGGASAPILEDPRWAAVLPGRNWKPKTLGRSATLASLGGSPVPGPFTVLAPAQRAVGSRERREGETVLESERSLGLGNVVVLGYSPLEPPLNAWDGRTRLMARRIRSGDTQRARQFVGGYMHTDPQEAYYAGSSGVARPAFGSPQENLGDPFSTKLPATSAVFGILGLYFVLVVPVSFLVLRKMKRGELAWITAPALSLGFAALLFQSAQGLYSAALSSASQGVLVVQQGVPGAMFYGTSQLFFPRGGVYDLKLSGVDSLSGVQQENQYYGYGGRGNTEGLEGFNLVDTGEMVAPRLEASNLAFRELSYSQKVEADDWFRFSVQGGGKVRVENRSPYDFSGRLVDGEYAGTSFDLAPGSSKIVPTRQGESLPKGADLGGNDVRNFTRSDGRIALSGALRGFRPGPQLGKEVESRSGVAVLAFAQETLRP